MRAEVVTLRLQKICGQAVGGVAVEIAECRRHRGCGHAVCNCCGRDLAPCGNQLFHCTLEIRIKQEVRQLRVIIIRFLDLAQENAADDAAAAPHERDAAVVEVPAVGLCRRAHEGVALCVGDDLGGIQRLTDGLDHLGLVAGEGRDRAGVFLRRFDALCLHRRQAAREHSFADERQRDAFIQRRDARPLARALLTGGVEDLFYDGLTVGVLVRENIACDLN